MIDFSHSFNETYTAIAVRETTVLSAVRQFFARPEVLAGIGIILFVATLPSVGCRMHRGPVSDHFDGSRFFHDGADHTVSGADVAVTDRASQFLFFRRAKQRRLVDFAEIRFQR